jgi:uncharacterized membrane protein YkoI
VTPKLKQGLTVAAAVGAAALGGTAIAGATGNGNSNDNGNRGGERPPRETALTGSTADKVKQAALARVDGTVLRVETDEGGVYEAHVRKADGTEVEVKVDRNFEVTAVEEHRGGPGGRGGPGHHGPGGPGGGERPLTGTTADKVKQAALARVKGTVLRVETDRDGAYEAHIRKADGTEVEVKVNRQFKATAVESGRHP